MKKFISLSLIVFIISLFSFLCVSAATSNTTFLDNTSSQETEASASLSETASSSDTESTSLENSELNTSDAETTMVAETSTDNSEKDDSIITDTTVFDNSSNTIHDSQSNNNFILYILIAVLAVVFIAVFLYLILA